MASSVTHLTSFFLLLVAILSSSMHDTHARDSQFFNKIANPNIAVPNPKESPNNINQQEQEPSFLPQNEESYGLYGHETSQLPPSTTTPFVNTDHHDQYKQPLSKYLPKNYNPVAYVTVPENTNEDIITTDDFKEETSFDTNPSTNTNINGEETEEEFPTTTSDRKEDNDKYYDNQQEDRESEYVNNKNNFYKLGSDFNSPRETTMMYGNDVREGFQPQGMSDTRFLENGKYHYDVNTGKFSSNHPYEKLKGVSTTATTNNEFGNYNRNYYGSNTMNNENVFNGENYNSVGGYDQNQNEDGQFENEDSNMP